MNPPTRTISIIRQGWTAQTAICASLTRPTGTMATAASAKLVAKPMNQVATTANRLNRKDKRDE